MKQYFTKVAYDGNTHVVLCENGRVINDNIVSDYNLVGYLEGIEQFGYVPAIFADEYEMRIKELENELDAARREFSEIAGQLLQLNNEDAMKYFPECFPW